MAALLDRKTMTGRVYCPICTHTVEAEVTPVDRGITRKMKVVAGQKCRRCSGLLDAAYILDVVAPLNG
jgi:uncharacterized Zn finger protein (UPF0148 family)